MTNPLSPDTKAWGCIYTPAIVNPGQSYWRLVQADGPMEIGGNHHVFVDVWDEAGNRIVGVPVVFYWREGDATHEDRKSTEAKPGEFYAVDWPMYAGGNAYGVRLGGGLASDDIFGFGMGSFVPHHCFRLIFQRTVSDQVPMPRPGPAPIPVPPDPPITAAEALEWADYYLQMARRLL